MTFREGGARIPGRGNSRSEVTEVGKHIVKTAGDRCSVGWMEGHGSDDTGQVSPGLFTCWALGNGEKCLSGGNYKAHLVLGR